MRIEPSTCTLEVVKSGALTYYAMGAVSVAVLNGLSDIQHGAPKRVQRKKRLNITPGKSVLSADYNNNIDDPQPTTSVVNRIVFGAPTGRSTANHQEDSDVNTDSSISSGEEDDSSSSSSITSSTDSDATIDIPVVSQCKEIEVGSLVLIAFEPDGKGHTYYCVGEKRRQGEKGSYDVKKCCVPVHLYFQ